ncbi:hypothetical protein JCM8097_002631 [Rhodosporidiobolus ruineniae]
MVHFTSALAASALLLSSVAPGALAAPARPLPLRRGAESGLMKSAAAAVKRGGSVPYSSRSYESEADEDYAWLSKRERKHRERARQPPASEPDHLLEMDAHLDARLLKEKRDTWLSKKAFLEKTGAVLDADVAGIENHLKRRGEQALSLKKRTPVPSKHAAKRSKKALKHRKRDLKPQSKKKASPKKGNKVGSKTANSSLLDADVKVALGREKRELIERGLATAGVPGFVEVATPLFNSTLARTIAGLVFLSNPDSTNATSSFVLGTSSSQSTQFYLTNAANPDPATPADLNVVNIRVPILDSQKLVSTDYCASFDLTPPSPLELMPCGESDSYSQNFAYNGSTGELQPLYSSTPAPMALVSTPVSANATTSAGNSTTSASPEPTSTFTESVAPPTATNGTSANSFAVSPADNDTDEEDEPEVTDIGLFFVPASAYYSAPQLVNSLIQKTDNGSAIGDDEASSSNSTATATPSGLVAANATATTSSEIHSSSASSSAVSSSASPSSAASATSTPVPTVLPASHLASHSASHSGTTRNALASESSSASGSSTLDSSSSAASSTADVPLSTLTVTVSASASSGTPTTTSSSSAISTASTASSTSAPASASMSQSATASSASATPTVTLQPAEEKTGGSKMRRVRRFARW